jgi:peroxiredoxin
MPNSLTGDFEAMLQVSGRVIDRLMASLHQNEGVILLPFLIGAPPEQQIPASKPPSFPHSLFLRIGDPLPADLPLLALVIGQPTLQDASQHDSVSSSVSSAAAFTPAGTLQQASSSGSAVARATAMADALDGVRGIVRAQAGAPRIELINAARRFVVEVPIRARYTPDVGTVALPEFIHGVVRAEYTVREIVLPIGKRLLRFAVVPANVTFQSYGPDTSDDARIARQIARVLQTRYLASDQQIGFPLSTIKSLVGGGFSALIVALPVTDPEPQGNLNSYTTSLLAGSDFAVAMSRDTIVSLADTMLAGLAVERPPERIAWAIYTIISHPFHAAYSVESLGLGLGDAGIITVTGRISLNTTDDWLPNVDVDITQRLKLALHPVSGSLMLTPDGDPKIERHYSNALGYVVDFFVGSYISNIIASEVNKAVVGAAPELSGINPGKSKLEQALRKLDFGAKCRFTAAQFQVDGMVLRGQIQLSPRLAPVIEFNKLETLDGYSACPSWLPGGRIDSFHWRWSWFYPTASALINPPAQAGSSVSHTDRFLMRSQNAAPGLASASANLMTGAVCLNIRGVQMDPQSGDPVQVDTSLMVLPYPVCKIFSPQLHVDVPSGQGRLLSRLKRKSLHEPQTVWPEVALLDLGGGTRISEGHNTLVCYFAEPPRPDDFRAIGRSMQESSRNDAGLLISVVLGARVSGSERDDSRSELQEALAAIPTYVLVTDDVQGSWADAFEFRRDQRGPQLRLIVPGGRVAWSAEGALDAGQLAAALREYLVAAPLPESEPVALGLVPGAPAPATLLELAPSEGVTLRALRGSPVVVCFVRANSESSERQLTRLEEQANAFARRGAQLIAIVDQVDAHTAHAIKHKLALNYHVAGDPDSAITRRWGIRLWPTTVFIDESGIVERVELGDGGAAFDARELLASAY